MYASPEKYKPIQANKEEKRNRFIKKGLVASALAVLALAGSPEEAKAGDHKELPFLDSVTLVPPKKVLEKLTKDTNSKPKFSKKAQLAKKILDNENVAYWENEGVNTKTVIEDLAQDKQAKLTCGELAGQKVDVDKGILQFILKVANDGDYIMVNAVTDKCHSDGSNHYAGEAVDLDCTTEASFDELEADAREFNGTNNGEYCGPSSHYHFDFK